MRKVLNIHIPEPCHEDWHKMTPTEQGRHCAVCRKNVFDFTSKSDEQIVKTFENNNNVCGRFKPTQLHRDIVLSRKKRNNYLSFAGAWLMAFLGISNQTISSQNKPKIEQLDTIKQGKVIVNNKTINNKTPQENIINGTVLDAEKIPLPGVNIILKNTTNGVVTDFDGEFSINAKLGDTLIVSYLGYKTLEIPVTTKFTNTISLEMEEMVLGGLSVVVGGAISNSTYVYTTEEEKEHKAKRKFRIENGRAFYKRKRQERRLKIKNGEIDRSSVGKFFYNLTNIFR